MKLLKGSRIRKHDQIKQFVAEKRQGDIAKATIRVRDDRKKLDLVIKREEEVIVADVTIRY